MVWMDRPELKRHFVRDSPDNAPDLPRLVARITVEGDSGLDRHISIAISSSCGAVSELKSVTHPTTKSANVKQTAQPKAHTLTTRPPKKISDFHRFLDSQIRQGRGGNS